MYESATVSGLLFTTIRYHHAANRMRVKIKT